MTNRLMAAAALVLLGACSQGAEAPEKTIQQLMAEEVQPAAEVYWDAVRFESVLENDEPVERDIKPETDEDWARVKAAAAKLGELGALLQTPGYAEGRGEDWVQFSKSLVEVSQLAEQAADAKDVEKEFEVGGTIYSVCSACHQVYPPAEGVPEGGAVEEPAA
jgi:hypothetical protein